MCIRLHKVIFFFTWNSLTIMKYTCCFDFRDVDQNIKIVNIFVTISQMYFLNIFVAEFKEKMSMFF